MGCDIHAFTETQAADGTWSVPLEPNPYYDDPKDRPAKAREFAEWHLKRGDITADQLDAEAEKILADNISEGEGGYWDNSPLRLQSAPLSRNYGLFAILANVRNGRGFAGCKTGEWTQPIADPRGIPADASPQYLQEVESWGPDGHSHTYFTLAELLAYPWEIQTVINSRLVHPNGWASFIKKELPETFDFDAFAIEVELVLNVEGEEAAYQRWPNLAMAGGVSGKGAEEWRRVTWKVTYKDQAGAEWQDYLEKLQAYAKEQELTEEQVRVVMFFDN